MAGMSRHFAYKHGWAFSAAADSEISRFEMNVGAFAMYPARDSQRDWNARIFSNYCLSEEDLKTCLTSS